MKESNNNSHIGAAATVTNGLNLLFNDDPSLLQFNLIKPISTTFGNNEGDVDAKTYADTDNRINEIVYPYASHLLFGAESTASTSTASSDTATAHTSTSTSTANILYNIDKQLTVISSLMSKLLLSSEVNSVVYNSSEIKASSITNYNNVSNPITHQLLALHGFNTTSNNDETTTRTAGTVMTTANATTASSTTTLYLAMCDSSIRIERTAEHLLNTSIVRIEAILQKAVGQIQLSTSTLQNILSCQVTIKYIIRILYELVHNHQYSRTMIMSSTTSIDQDEKDEDEDNNDDEYEHDSYDWPRDIIRSATSITSMEELIQLIDNGTNTKLKQKQNKPIIIMEMIRPVVSNISANIRKITKQKLQTAVQYLQYQIDNLNPTGDAASTIASKRLLSYDHTSIQYEVSSILQIYYSLHELYDIVFYTIIENHFYQNCITITQSLLSNMQSQRGGQNVHVNENCVEIYVQQMSMILQQFNMLLNILSNKHDPATRTNFYYALYTSSTNNSVPKIYERYICDDNTINYHQSSSYLLQLFWYRYCHNLSTMLIEYMNTSSTSNKMTNNMDTIVSYYPHLHVAAFRILQHFNSNSSVSSCKTVANHYTTSDTSNVSYEYNYDEYYSSASIRNVLSSGIVGVSSIGGGFGSCGILGGSEQVTEYYINSDNPQSGSLGNSTTTQAPCTYWSRPQQQFMNQKPQQQREYGSPSSLSSIRNTSEWKAYQGYTTKDDTSELSRRINRTQCTMGLYPLQQAFVSACKDRLMVPIQYMFHENVTISDDGVSMSTGMIILPSKYDIQRFDENIRNELALAIIGRNTNTDASSNDMTTIIQLIGQCINTIISEFCIRAKSALMVQQSEPYINERDWSITESMKHDCKIIAILYTMKQYLQMAPEKTFTTPHQNAVSVCSETLQTAICTIDTTIINAILVPFCRTVNRLVATNVLSKIHLGVYLDNNSVTRNSYSDDVNNDTIMQASFIQNDVVPVLDLIVQSYFIKFPATYSNMMACNFVSFIIYSYLSSVTLIRPLTESIRLHITQDLADLELALEQFLSKVNASSNTKLNLTPDSKLSNTTTTTTLQQIENGKPYAELRAVRQMLFWTGLDTKSKPADAIAKSLLYNEMWVKDVRPSTIFHYLFSFGPNMLSSPYHIKRTSATEYVKFLVPWDMVFSLINNVSSNKIVTNNTSIESGEDIAHMAIMACCDSYMQRASVSNSNISDVGSGDGDTRIAQIVITFGQELLRRRGRN